MSDLGFARSRHGGHCLFRSMIVIPGKRRCGAAADTPCVSPAKRQPQAGNNFLDHIRI
jgi:hypothetical protein